MSMEVHIDWQGETRLVGRLHAAERGSSVSFEYDAEWLQRDEPSRLIRPRSPCNAAHIMGQRFSGRFRIADLTVGGAS
jgi:hypothetical protein